MEWVIGIVTGLIVSGLTAAVAWFARGETYRKRIDEKSTGAIAAIPPRDASKNKLQAHQKPRAPNPQPSDLRPLIDHKNALC